MTVLATMFGSLPAVPPFPGFVQTFDYLPSRDGLALLTGGPSDAGYAANRVANTAYVWQPRYIPQGNAPKGGTDVYSGNYQFNADPEYAWSNRYTPFAIVNGNLRIRAARTSTLVFAAGEVPIEPVSGAAYPFMSGILSSKNSFSQLGGYFEMVAQLPKGQAAWSAFWLMPVVETHPPEIDIIEYVSQQSPNLFQATGISLGAVLHATQINSGVDLSQGFHKYGLLWSDTTLTWYIDDVAGATLDITNYPEFSQPFYILLNMQVGSRLNNWVPAPDSTTPSTLDMLVRSVRVWQKPGPTGVVLSTSSYLDSIPVGGTVATISAASNFGTSGSNIATKVSDPDNMFVLAGNNLNLTQSIPATTAASHALRLQLTDSLGRSVQRSFNIGVITGTPTQANYITTSDLTNGFWNKQNITATATDTLLEAATSSSHFIYANSVIPRAAGVKTFNAWVEVRPTLGRSWLNFQLFDSGYGSSVQAWFDSLNGAVGFYTQSGAWANCVPFVSVLPSGAVRCGFKFTTDAATTGFQCALKLATGQDGDNYAGDVTKGIKLSNFWLYNIGAAAGGT